MRIRAIALCLCAWLCLFSSAALLAQTPPATAGHPLRQIILTAGLDGAEQLPPVPDGGFVVLTPSLSFADRKELASRLAAGENRIIDERLLAAIAQVVEHYFRHSDYVAATAIVPPQNIAGGIVRVAVLLGKVRNIKVEGNRWFSESLLREKLRIERGEIVRVSELNQALNWTNTSSFRHVRMHVEPVPATGEADLFIKVQERLPLRLALSYDNTGNEALGENRYAAALTYGNLWGRDHQLSYHFVTTDDIEAFRAHGAEYRAPLPWRHVIVASASYAEVTSSFFDGLFVQDGKSLTADLKYVAPLSFGRWRAELSGGVTFKQTNNNLEFGGTPALNATSDLLTLGANLAALREDTRGRWIASFNLVGSPGQFNSRSSERVYFDSRIGAKPRFLYSQFTAVRLTRLTPTLTSTLRGNAQLASTNLLPSEQLAFGGLTTVRGYEERVLAADGGYGFTHELQQRFPSVTLKKDVPAFDTAGVLFWDYGRVIFKHTMRNQDKAAYLASVGVGLRASLGNYFSASVDYGYQLEKIEIPGAPHDRVHVRVSLSY